MREPPPLSSSLEGPSAGPEGAQGGQSYLYRCPVCKTVYSLDEKSDDYGCYWEHDEGKHTKLVLVVKLLPYRSEDGPEPQSSDLPALELHDIKTAFWDDADEGWRVQCVCGWESTANHSPVRAREAIALRR
jgi:hypothetical protein